MKNMTDTTFTPAEHPRSSLSGRFVAAQKSAPEAGLLTAERTRPADVQDAIDMVTFGREQLDARFDAGQYGYDRLVMDRFHIWRNAGGEDITVFKLEPHLNTHGTTITPDSIERILEVTHWRAVSGRYETDDNGDLHVVPVGADELRAADYQAEARGDYVSEEWNAGRNVGAEAEVSDHVAKLFAESALQSLRQDQPIINYPRLAEMAVRPFSGAAGASPEKVDALHAEIRNIRETAHYLSPRERVRLDMLATYAMHAVPEHTS
jgi:hypothetical protein